MKINPDALVALQSAGIKARAVTNDLVVRWFAAALDQYAADAHADDREPEAQ